MIFSVIASVKLFLFFQTCTYSVRDGEWVGLNYSLFMNDIADLKEVCITKSFLEVCACEIFSYFILNIITIVN